MTNVQEVPLTAQVMDEALHRQAACAVLNGCTTRYEFEKRCFKTREKQSVWGT